MVTKRVDSTLCCSFGDDVVVADGGVCFQGLMAENDF